MTFDWSKQARWEDVHLGDPVPPLSFPLPLHRLVVHAGANRDYSLIHHNSDVAKQQGALEAYANNVFHQGTWERTVRQYIGLQGVIKKIGPFRMKKFAVAGETVVVSGTVTSKWQEGGERFVELAMVSTISTGDAASGTVTVTMP